MKNGKWMAVILLVTLAFEGCAGNSAEKTKRQELPFEFVEEEKLPKELAEEMWEKKEKSFRIVYSDMDYLYIAEGYGEKEQEDSCIEITTCEESKDAIYIEMTLHGQGGEGRECETIFPYCVIRTKFQEKPVIFED